MNHKTEQDRYEDIIHLPHHTSLTRPRMSMLERAAQFSPFAALSGHDAAIKETARVTGDAVELDEERKAALNQKLCAVMARLAEKPQITVTYFQPDEKKAGGTYISLSGSVKKVDAYHGIIVFTDHTVIPMDAIYEIEGEGLE